MSAVPLYVIENFPPSIGGVETFNRALFSEIAERISTDDAPAGTILVGPEGRAWIQAEAPAIAAAFEIPAIEGGKRVLLAAAEARLRHAPPSVCCILRASKKLKPLLPLADRLGVPVAVYVHGRTSTFDRWPPAFWWRRRTQLHRARAVATNSEYMARELGRVGHPRSSVTVIPLGLAEQFRPQKDLRQSERNAHELGDAPLLVTVSRLVGAKGHARLLRVFPRLRELHPNLRWWIVGDGPSRDELTAAIEASGAKDAIWLRGAMPDPRPALAAADLFVLLAEEEAFGLAALEAQAMGVPAIVLSGSGPEEIVLTESETETGAVLPPDDEQITRQMLEWLGDRERREMAGERASAHAQRFTWAQTTDQFLAWLRGATAP